MDTGANANAAPAAQLLGLPPRDNTAHDSPFHYIDVGAPIHPAGAPMRSYEAAGARARERVAAVAAVVWAWPGVKRRRRKRGFSLLRNQHLRAWAAALIL